jgi:DNA anti-recombination protein RmuC
MQQKLVERWNKYAEPLMQALTVRQGERTASLQRDLQNRAEREMADITAILTELQTSILKELDEPQVEQLTLFSTPE